jgi:hypothetical protein
MYLSLFFLIFLNFFSFKRKIFKIFLRFGKYCSVPTNWFPKNQLFRKERMRASGCKTINSSSVASAAAAAAASSVALTVAAAADAEWARLCREPDWLQFWYLVEGGGE